MDTMQLRGGSLVGCAAFVVVVAGMKAAAVLVVPFLLAGFLAIICAPPLYWMQRKGIPSVAGILILMAGVIVLQVMLVSLVSSSIADFTKNLPFFQERLLKLMSGSLTLLSDYGIQVEADTLTEVFNPSRILKMVYKSECLGPRI